MNRNLIIEVLKQEVVPALGCTEPAAVALCSSIAYKHIEGKIKNIKVEVSTNIYKNGMSVGIPGINIKGLNVAAALGATGGNPDYKLEVLKKITSESIEEGKELVYNNKIQIEINDKYGDLFVSCRVETDNGYGLCQIKDKHTNVILIEVNGVNIYESNEAAATSDKEKISLKDFKLFEIFECIESIDPSDMEFLIAGAEMNLNMARTGLESESGMGVGRNIKSNIEIGLLGDDLYQNIVMMTAAGADARMSGYFMPVMSSAGSGNHGLTAIIPVAVMAERLNIERDKLIKALALSHITTIYIKQFTGRLSSICGCGVAAATGAAVGMTYMLGGGEREFEFAIKNMAGDLAGMICDGAKAGCAVKLSTSAGSALKAALLAISSVGVPEDNGIVGRTAEDTIKNIGIISTVGMESMDKTILDIMISKSNVN